MLRCYIERREQQFLRIVVLAIVADTQGERYRSYG